MGDMFTSSINGSMYTYEVAPVFSKMELEFFEYLKDNYIHWNEIDGVFTPGGSLSNYYALLCARHKTFPNIKDEGIQN